MDKVDKVDKVVEAFWVLEIDEKLGSVLMIWGSLYDQFVDLSSFYILLYFLGRLIVFRNEVSQWLSPMNQHIMFSRFFKDNYFVRLI